MFNVCGHNHLIRFNTSRTIRPAADRAGTPAPGRRPLTASNVGLLDGDALAKVIGTLRQRPSLTAPQRALLDAAELEYRTRFPTGRLGVDPALVDQVRAGETNVRPGSVVDRAAGLVNSLLDSADDSTPTAPDKVIEMGLEAVGLAKKPTGIVVKFFTDALTNSGTDEAPGGGLPIPRKPVLQPWEQRPAANYPNPAYPPLKKQ